MEQHPDRPVVGQKVKLKGGDMEFDVFHVDDVNETVELTPVEQGFSMVRNVPFDHVQRIAKNGQI